MSGEELSPDKTGKLSDSESRKDKNDKPINAACDNDEDMDLGNAEIEEEEEAGDENLDTSAPGRDEDRDKDEDNEDSSARAWDGNQDNFNDFQFERENMEGGPANTAENVEGRLAGLWADGDKVLTAKIDSSRRFVCVDYPCVVQNLEKALTTLEGPKAISKVLAENGRLPLYFRPGDSFCKPVYANCILSQNLLVRVRRRKKKKPQDVRKRAGQTPTADPTSSGSTPAMDPESTRVMGQDDYEYQLVVEGIVDRMYMFDGMCDFQYLPVMKTQNQTAGQSTSAGSGGQSSYREFLSQLVPQFDDEREEYFSRPVPLFLPPLIFSRRQIPVPFQFEDDTPVSRNLDVIETERKTRFVGSIHVTFDHSSVPTEPHPDTQLCLEKLPENQRETGLVAVRKLFEERPLWSRAGVEVNIEPRYRQYIKFLLPMVAFYFTNGAWKNLWCKLGHDPRKIPASKVYQTVDFRIRNMLNRSSFEGKREQYMKGAFRFNTETPSVTTGIIASSDVQFMSNLNATYAAKHIGKKVKELQYIFYQGVMPPFRQMRYQVCDIHHPEVQAKLHENDGKETVCTERDGWCVPDFTDICRDILYRDVQKLQAAQGQ
ncbi:general transcription factor 3C polypeptide 5 [Elysia marginata]|uniref:General transcription factor 3C polypeptide 5 n=1 Tax=Elysia marginata TaxID=1093978 RepID=A0AAV4J151_9GAST|nr:general transcription factor 3C polypeptide 5 [Elysia marginata]